MALLGWDWSRASPPRVQAGDIIKVHTGVYLSKHDHYSHEINSGFITCCGTPWDATYYLTQNRSDFMDACLAMNVLDPFEVAYIEVWPLDALVQELGKKHKNAFLTIQRPIRFQIRGRAS
jgi:hypothetical protein